MWYSGAASAHAATAPTASSQSDSHIPGAVKGDESGGSSGSLVFALAAPKRASFGFLACFATTTSVSVASVSPSPRVASSALTRAAWSW